MEAQAVLDLFDTLWFHNQSASSSSAVDPDPELVQQDSYVSSQLSISSKSVEDFACSSPDSVLNRGISVEIRKNVADERRKRYDKSLSELEFEEVKGFMDLGFVFCEDENDSRLIEIIPGLQRLGHPKETKEMLSEQRVRPYLSEAWGNRIYARKEAPLVDWRVLDVGDEADLKDSLKSWAQTVASAVR